MTMTITIDCKRCAAVYHADIKSFKKHQVRVKFPFCKRSEKVKVGVDDE